MRDGYFVVIFLVISSVHTCLGSVGLGAALVDLLAAWISR